VRGNMDPKLLRSKKSISFYLLLPVRRFIQNINRAEDTTLGNFSGTIRSVDPLQGKCFFPRFHAGYVDVI